MPSADGEYGFDGFQIRLVAGEAVGGIGDAGKAVFACLHDSRGQRVAVEQDAAVGLSGL